MYRKFLWIVAFTLSFGLSQSAFSDSWGCGEGMKGMLQSLKLETAQKEKIKPIVDQLRSSMKAFGKQMGDLDTQINQQLGSDTPDQSAIDSLVDQKAKLIGSMVKAKMAAKSQIFTILTPEQKKSLQGMMKKLDDKIAAKFKSCHKDD